MVFFLRYWGQKNNYLALRLGYLRVGLVRLWINIPFKSSTTATPRHNQTQLFLPPAHPAYVTRKDRLWRQYIGCKGIRGRGVGFIGKQNWKGISQQIAFVAFPLAPGLD
jgi:hypothetical protein